MNKLFLIYLMLSSIIFSNEVRDINLKSLISSYKPSLYITDSEYPLYRRFYNSNIDDPNVCISKIRLLSNEEIQITINDVLLNFRCEIIDLPDTTNNMGEIEEYINILIYINNDIDFQILFTKSANKVTYLYTLNNAILLNNKVLWTLDNIQDISIVKKNNFNSDAMLLLNKSGFEKSFIGYINIYDFLYLQKFIYK